MTGTNVYGVVHLYGLQIGAHGIRDQHIIPSAIVLAIQLFSCKCATALIIILKVSDFTRWPE